MTKIALNQCVVVQQLTNKYVNSQKKKLKLFDVYFKVTDTTSNPISFNLNLNMTQELLLDPQIKMWILCSMVLVFYLAENLTYYLVLLFGDERKLSLAERQDRDAKKRVILLQKNYKFIPKHAFEIRKAAFHLETGFVDNATMVKPKTELLPYPASHWAGIVNFVKMQFCHHLPTIIVASSASFALSGYICLRVPFPLPVAFKPMLQRNLDLENLDPSWVSSCSWYILNGFGIRWILNSFFNSRGDRFIFPDMFDIGPANKGISKSDYRDDYNNLQTISYENGLEEIELDNLD
ncbi:unnamed protein product [Ceutorhynchus assimilis]|uniref:ER membrane protein complex subunit 3 n=1 Tax=Ceutorhynchus assimilis TaxID=467358 RepID=A0A9N9MVX0_9CUCU|nr:unnamed protein product [Ceutorhynchus assimilis]